ncbi:MAG: TIGR03086 family metal-binding protein [Phycicoccus sp.]
MELLVTRHAAAARQTVLLATQAVPDRLSLPTPCAGWDLRRLLDHMTTENLGFAAAAHGRGDDPAVWVGDLGRADPVADYVAATDALLEAFAEPGVLQRSFALPLLTREQEFPGEQAVMMQLVDSVAHTWDLARTLRLALTVDDEIVEPVLALCEQLPDDESRRAPGAPFGPAVPVPRDAPPLDRVVALLGRSPTWPR